MTRQSKLVNVFTLENQLPQMAMHFRLLNLEDPQVCLRPDPICI